VYQGIIISRSHILAHKIISLQRYQMQLISLVLLSLIISYKSSTAFSAANDINVASSIKMSPVNEMERGVGGRIEDAFASAKEKAEAAFVTFVTAGYPRAAGMLTALCFVLCEH
jgi:hypothetical protein